MGVKGVMAKSLTLLSTVFLVGMTSAQLDKYLLENYSFDYTSGVRPLAWKSYGNTIELANTVKLNPAVENKYGGYVFDGKLE